MTRLALVFLFYVQVLECSTFGNIMQPAPEYLTNMMGCEEGWYSLSRKCYKYGGNTTAIKLSWEKASDYCRDDGGSLVVIENQATQDLIRVILVDVQEDVWIGLHDRQKEGEYTWVDESIFNYKNWKTGEPSGASYGDEDCTQMLFWTNDEDIGKWNDKNCLEELHFICQKDQIQYTTAKVPLNPILCSEEKNSGLKFRNSCYNLVEEKKSWENAESYCRSKFSGHLVAVRSISVDVFLDYLLKDFTGDVWIGISLKKGVAQKWSNGFFVGYKGWGRSKKRFTEGFCATRIGSHRWSIAECTTRFAFICEHTTDVPPVLTQTVRDAVCPSQPNDWIDLDGNKCYFIEDDKKLVWYEANFLCVLRGGNLLSIHSKQEMDIIQEIIYPPEDLHIGLHRKSQEGNDFGWADRTQLSWTNWDVNEPIGDDEHCVELTKRTVKWNNIQCNETRRYICSVKKITPKLTTLNNLTDVEKNSKGKYPVFPDCISYGTLTAILGSTLFVVLALLGIILACYFKPWTRKECRKNITDPAVECNDIPEQNEMT